MSASRHPPSHARARALAVAAWVPVLVGSPVADAFTATITPGPRSVYLQVGAGSMTGGSYLLGGTPGSNAMVNTASVTVPALQLGTGVALDMGTDSPVANSPYDNLPICNQPAITGQVYLGGFFRRPGLGGADAILSVSTPASLTSTGGDTIPFTQLAWTSGGSKDVTPTVPSGSFSGGTQTLLSVPSNTWFESCLAFRYLNTALVPAGTFAGQATFTLSAP